MEQSPSASLRINVVGRNLDVTEAIRAYAHSKAAKLPKYFDGTQLITFTLSKDDHLTHGNFSAELVVDVEKHDDFVARASAPDLYAAIDEALHKGIRQLTDFKEQLKTGNR